MKLTHLLLLLFFFLTDPFLSCQLPKKGIQIKGKGAYQGKNEADSTKIETKNIKKGLKGVTMIMKTQNVPLRIVQTQINQTLIQEMCL